MTSRNTWRRAWSWLRIVLPPNWAVGCALAAWFSFAFGIDILVWLQTGVWADDPSRDLTWGTRLSIFVGATYGTFRASSFHPIMRPKYWAWLTTTPWSLRKPLPMGPITLAWQDLMVWAILMTMNACGFGEPLASVLLAAALCGYSAASIWVLLLAERYVIAYAVAFLLIVAVYAFVHFHGLFLAFVIASYVVAHVGMRRSLNGYPWPSHEYGWIALFTSDVQSLHPAMGVWPWMQLWPHPTPVGLTWREAVALPTLIVALVWVCAANLEYRAGVTISFVAASFGCIMAAAFRFAFYVNSVRSPISFLGRFATGRIIIPRFDLVVVAPLVALVAAYPVAYLSRGLGADVITAHCLGLWTALLAATCLGPRLASWKLIGNHRIAAVRFRVPVEEI